MLPFAPIWGVRTIGASGSIYGILVAFAVLFPYRQILVFFVFPLAPIGYATVPDEMGEIANTLVSRPFAFVFNRPLGQCNSVTLDY